MRGREGRGRTGGTGRSKEGGRKAVEIEGGRSEGEEREKRREGGREEGEEGREGGKEEQ